MLTDSLSHTQAKFREWNSVIIRRSTESHSESIENGWNISYDRKSHWIKHQPNLEENEVQSRSEDSLSCILSRMREDGILVMSKRVTESPIHTLADLEENKVQSWSGDWLSHILRGDSNLVMIHWFTYWPERDSSESYLWSKVSLITSDQWWST